MCSTFITPMLKQGCPVPASWRPAEFTFNPNPTLFGLNYQVLK